MKEVSLAGGMVAFVDDEDFAITNQYSWHTLQCKHSRIVYAVATDTRTKPRKTIYLHRLVLGAPDETNVDHKNRNGLDCQRNNLRLATGSQNQQNMAKCRTFRGMQPSSHFKGVTWDKSRKVWKAKGKLNGRTTNIGRFESETEAALAYNLFAIKYYGSFSRLNSIT
jgi:hypothetical protein